MGTIPPARAAQTLGGNLVVSLINGFTPASSDTFTILTTQTMLAGAFSNVASGGRLTTADGNSSFVVTYSGNNVVLSQFGNADPNTYGNSDANTYTHSDTESYSDTTFTSSSVTFNWTAGSATACALFVGSSSTMADIYNSGVIHSLSATVTNMPIDGRTIYVTLASQVNGSWTANRYTYTASNSSK
jgi:hypothetical protein